MTRRGITLTEVLVTIFVLAIGLLALLTLFPLAALNMQQAIQDDRVASAVAAATAVYDMYNDFRPGNDNTQSPQPNAKYAGSYFLNPNGGPAAANFDFNGPSYPLYIDPVGAVSAQSTWVGGVGGAVRRVTSPWLNPASTYNLYPSGVSSWKLDAFHLQDDMVFDQNGVPLGNPTRGLQRGTQYSWAYLVRRPRAACASVVDCTVVVYAGRPVYSSGTSAGETVCKAQPDAISPVNTIDLTVPRAASGPGPTLRKGTWLLDITQETGAAASQYGPVHAVFYRTQNVESISANRYRVEVQGTLRAPVTARSQFVLMDNVAAVFEKGPGWRAPRYRSDE